MDEIVIVDTGSTDRTKEIAREYGAIIRDFKWCDNFSAARNKSIKYAKGDWILFLDADEELIDGDLREAVKTEHDGLFLGIVNFAGEGEEQVLTSVLRLFRNKGYKFEGRIHEQILPSIQKRGGTVGATNVSIKHYGYLNSAVIEKGKMERNLRIVEREAQSRPGSFNFYALGMEYLRKGEYQKALEAFMKSLALLPSVTVQYGSRLVLDIALCSYLLGDSKTALEQLANGKESYPDYTDLYHLEGVILLNEREFDKAEKAFREALSKGVPNAFHISDAGVGTYKAWHGLGKALEGKGDKRGALFAYEKSLLSHNVFSPAVHDLACLLLSVADKNTVREDLSKVADFSNPLVKEAFESAVQKQSSNEVDVCE